MATTYNSRSTIRPADYLVDKRRAEEMERSRMVETTQYYAKAALQSTFEDQSAASVKRNAIRRRVDELKGQEVAALESRREKLRKMLLADEDLYERELVASEESTEHRIEVMRARVKELKDRREQERKAIVEEKLMQRWRNECDDLRALESKVIVKAVTDARSAQLVEHEERKVEEAEERKKYDALWEADRQKKIAREEADKSRQRDLNEQMLTMLDEQMAQLRVQAEQEEELKPEHEAQTAEAARLRMKKEHEQRLVRTELDRFNKAKIAQRAKDARESLEMDLKIVSEFLEADAKDKAAKSAKKKALREEMLSYRDSLVAQRETVKEREKEIDARYREEEEKMWKLRAEKWQREQRARDKLMQEVIQSRQEQLRLQMDQVRFKQEQARLESAEIRRRIEATRAAEAHERAAVMERRDKYKETLGQQVAALNVRRGEERRRVEDETIADRAAQASYEALLKSELERALRGESARYTSRLRAYQSVPRKPSNV
ncbi:hypothetical protein SmJEL517_g05091 [Synchytrium microbalum]|uniref:Cilia- and flagella-associated protein 53 n=1 Tax=Synchytrium microbalum TaxID=1806994 RepID=A0A507C0U0_9FUNG|nr:uncharacterized protein SmJEL517_g05091 [Synchytrium microbalum]TPX31586.1 hypothetical protein SmJEL517_g05091 [Synchytrium microbalum]